VGVSYVAGLTKEAKKYLQKEYKNFCAYCLHAVLGNAELKPHHTGVGRALAVYREDNPGFDPRVAPVPYEGE
jgi:hypothetical protein